ncbi:hypothetical protein C8R46DRAFT_1140712 [Mycena filopes]|nr:hypothetical protein C8R46DRAFT_1140712 [Mycena filopes]
MRAASALLALASLGVVSAQQVVTVKVGGDPGTLYTPNNINASIGTIVSFEFSGIPGNHTVTQSSLATPCEPLAGGFDSGWVFFNSSGPAPVWNLTITDDTKPIWFYCKQLEPILHCKNGMSGVINLGQGNLSAFKASASAVSTVGEAEGAFVGIGASATGAPSLAPGASYYNPSISVTPTAPPAGSATGSGASGGGGASPSKPPSSALATGASIGFTFLATAFGVALVL